MMSESQTLMIVKNRSVEMDKNDWRQDPAVRSMRRVFSGMETALDQILEGLSISRYDQRIRSWLEAALPKFEKAWSLAHHTGMKAGENEAHLGSEVLGRETQVYAARSPV